jgi:hypothetical protein
MKRGLITIFLLLFAISLAQAICSLNVELINQDPYPAIQGDYIKLVFQVTGVENPECGEVTFHIDDTYPFYLEDGGQRTFRMKSGIYSKDYPSYLLAPYRMRIDQNGLDGENPLTIYYSFRSQGTSNNFQEDFNITLQDSRTDFEVHIESYSPETKELNIELLNIGKVNVEAVTVEIPKQENIEIIGSNRNIIGDIDTNEDDRTNFNANLKQGQIKLLIYYTDQIGVRRSIEKYIESDLENFSKSVESKKGINSSTAFILGILITIILIYTYKYFKKKKSSKR